jgi:hypothetical protein
MIYDHDRSSCGVVWCGCVARKYQKNKIITTTKATTTTQTKHQQQHQHDKKRKTFNLCSKHFSSLPFFFRLQIFALTEKTFSLGR